ncbi:MAG: dicarboxylate/amino acid:cation symporter [Paludibacterium sp.]|uniref:dicarboxylate/amino acid:cation symporter n=1 Tax=Paludibacterium sp. TaxID=1917523 RepID=UPI0025D774F2|nr:dicarboxylate/amino acid:cation symporter [Paludibacterium sp.]MBV8049259.1 dicarboxylate/amino acid:cation symporter [Paludibacterium sp.]MBV8648273.1 dicarboxylate/amino acid:cation symporter [Paludibacterium sp.]
MKSNKITMWVGIALILGIVVGFLCHNSLDAASAKNVAGNLSILTDVFLRMIKMIIGPLVFSTLVVGIANSDTKSVGRIGTKAMAWFIGASLVSLLIGMFYANVLQPGVGYNLPMPTGSSGLKTSAINLHDFISHMFPKSFFEAMTNNEMLQIVVFSLFFGISMAQLKNRFPTTLVKMLDDVAHTMLKLTGIVMAFAPLGVFGAVASTISTQGLGVLVIYARFLGAFIVAIATLWVFLLGIGYLYLGRRIFALMKKIRAPMMLGFATASSEAAFPKVLEQLDAFGVDSKISGFVLPLGYSFNLAASVMYASFAALFIAQVYNIPMSLGSQLTMLLVLMVTSKGIAGVPRASLVVVAAVLPMFHLPETGIMLILGIDQFLDMIRTTTNVMANSIATTTVAKMENMLGEEQPDVVGVAAEPVTQLANQEI